jgi:NADP-dependent 3-hydroxy acid dehydrogenase YdfG
VKSIIVTGASQGIGKATAEAFLEAGWRVGVLARSADKLEALANKYDAAVPLVADVTDAAAMESAFARFVARTERLDALFNNAGMFGPTGPIDEVDLGGFDQVLDVNVRGMFIAQSWHLRRCDAKCRKADGSSITALCQRMCRAKARCVTR